VLGDTNIETVFADYRRAGPLSTPYDIEERIGGYPTHVYALRSIDPAAADAPDLFAVPADPMPTTPPPDAPTLHALGLGVYEILGPYNVMFAVFDDYVLLAEAPLSTAYTQSCLDLIASVAPGKPIRAVSTHFHYDHVGGVRALVGHDIPILTTADARPVIEQALGSTKSIRPDGFVPAGHHPAIGVAGPITTLADSGQRVLIFHIGPTEHVADMLIVYFANARTLFVADLWDVPTARQAIAGPDAELLLARVRELGLDVARMVPVHGVPATAADLARGLAIRARHVEAARAP